MVAFDLSSQIVFWNISAITNITDHYNPSARIPTLLLTPLMLCVFFYRWVAGPTVPSRFRTRDFWKTFHRTSIYSPEFLQEICWRVSLLWNIFIFRFVGGVWPGVWRRLWLKVIMMQSYSFEFTLTVTPATLIFFG